MGNHLDILRSVVHVRRDLTTVSFEIFDIKYFRLFIHVIDILGKGGFIWFTQVLLSAYSGE